MADNLPEHIKTLLDKAANKALTWDELKDLSIEDGNALKSALFKADDAHKAVTNGKMNWELLNSWNTLYNAEKAGVGPYLGTVEEIILGPKAQALFEQAKAGSTLTLEHLEGLSTQEASKLQAALSNAGDAHKVVTNGKMNWELLNSWNTLYNAEKEQKGPFAASTIAQETETQLASVESLVEKAKNGEALVKTDWEHLPATEIQELKASLGAASNAHYVGRGEEHPELQTSIETLLSEAAPETPAVPEGLPEPDYAVSTEGAVKELGTEPNAHDSITKTDPPIPEEFQSPYELAKQEAEWNRLLNEEAEEFLTPITGVNGKAVIDSSAPIELPKPPLESTVTSTSAAIENMPERPSALYSMEDVGIGGAAKTIIEEAAPVAESSGKSIRGGFTSWVEKLGYGQGDYVRAAEEAAEKSKKGKMIAGAIVGMGAMVALVDLLKKDSRAQELNDNNGLTR